MKTILMKTMIKRLISVKMILFWRFSKRITESGGVLEILRHLEIADGQQ